MQCFLLLPICSQEISRAYQRDPRRHTGPQRICLYKCPKTSEIQSKFNWASIMLKGSDGFRTF